MSSQQLINRLMDLSGYQISDYYNDAIFGAMARQE